MAVVLASSSRPKPSVLSAKPTPAIGRIRERTFAALGALYAIQRRQRRLDGQAYRRAPRPRPAQRPKRQAHTTPTTGSDPPADPDPEKPAPKQKSIGEYDQQAEQLDSLHRGPPDVENRPPVDVVDAWTHARREALTLACLFRAIPTREASDHADALSGCQSSFFMVPTADGWTIPRSRSTLRRCSRRLCPVNALAAQRKSRIAIDRVAARLSSRPPQSDLCNLERRRPSVFRISGRAWKALRNQRGYRQAVQGAFVGVHLYASLNVHAHVLIATEQPLDADLLALWWIRACAAQLKRPGSVWAEPCHNPAAAIQYAARPARALMLDNPARLCELFALVKGARLARRSGIVAEYWDTETDPRQSTGPAVRYGWTWDDGQQPEEGSFDVCPE